MNDGIWYGIPLHVYHVLTEAAAAAASEQIKCKNDKLLCFIFGYRLLNARILLLRYPHNDTKWKESINLFVKHWTNDCQNGIWLRLQNQHVTHCLMPTANKKKFHFAGNILWIWWVNDQFIWKCVCCSFLVEKSCNLPQTTWE